MLIDKVEITVRAGKGGDGIVSWRREKFIPKGGPDGGDGGRGGSVIFVSTDNLDTLSSFRFRHVFQAGDGETGHSKKMYGAAGEDLELLVPTGTVITDLSTGKEIADFTKTKQVFIAAKGGRGGKGNVHFATATNQNPTQATKGTIGESRHISLELQMVADVALVGEPNAGKSSIISALTGVEARIGAYAFSTTHPVLGVLRSGDRRVTLIDLPGLIEGAHKGKGLGDAFLKHLKRVKAIIHVIDATSDTANSEKVIAEEIEQYDQSLVSLPKLIVINKTDLLSEKELKDLKKKHPHAVFVSAAESENLPELKQRILKLVD